MGQGVGLLASAVGLVYMAGDAVLALRLFIEEGDTPFLDEDLDDP